MSKYLRFIINDKKKEAPGVVTLYLSSEEALDYRAGQFITLLLENEWGKELRRSYSFSSAPGIDPMPSITVKQKVNGYASRYLTQLAEIGTALKSLAPAGQFTLDVHKNETRDIFLIGGGSGVTPLFSLLKNILKNEPQSHLVLMLANHSEQHIIFRKELNKWAEKYSESLQIIHLLSDIQQQLVWPANVLVRNTRLGNILLETLARRHLKYNPRKAQFFLCGPKGLMLKSLMVLRYLEFPERHIHREVFDIVEPFRPSPAYFPDAVVELKIGGHHYRFCVPAGANILEAAGAAGIDLPYSCRSGTCTTCVAKCSGGKVEMYTQDGKVDSTTLGGQVFTCVGYPVTREVYLEMS